MSSARISCGSATDQWFLDTRLIGRVGAGVMLGGVGTLASPRLGEPLTIYCA